MRSFEECSCCSNCFCVPQMKDVSYINIIYCNYSVYFCFYKQLKLLKGFFQLVIVLQLELNSKTYKTCSLGS